MLANNEPITPNGIREYIRYGGYKHYTINDLLKDYLKILAKRVDVDMTMGVYEKYKQASYFILKHIDGNQEVTALTPAFIQNLVADTYATYKVSTAIGYITKFKTFVKYAMDNNKLKVNPFQNIKLKREKTNIVYLTESELERIYNLDIDNESLSNIRDAFVLQACTGLAYCDIYSLEPSDIHVTDNGTHYINKQRHKTGSQFVSVILPMGVEILKKHDYKLKIISCQKYNAMLKTIQVLAGIDKNMTTHLARKTYATTLINRGVRIEAVSRALGHSNIKITQAAYSQLLNSSIIKEIQDKM